MSAEVIAGSAVGVSVIAVFAQLHGVRRQLFIQNFSEHNRRYREALDRFPRELLNNDFKISSVNDLALKDKIESSLWTYFDLCYEQWFLAKNRYVGKKLKRMWDSGLRSSMSRPPFQEGWALLNKRTKYPKEFKEYVTDLQESKIYPEE